jgi:ribose transport system ATP-binding protein
MPLLEIQNLDKSYERPVLVDFDFTLQAGETHALMGSNGAGKSTLARIICGLTLPDHGKLLLKNQPFTPCGRNEATEAGVVMVMQELNLFPNLSIAENLFFSRLPQTAGFIAVKKLRQQAQAALAQVNLQSLDPETPVGALGIGQQQLIEIAAALAQNCEVLILDEPTASLTAPETEILFRQITQLQERGVGILYISHRMDEIRRIANRVTTMRDGRRIGTHDVRTVTIPQIIREMSGSDLVAKSSMQQDRTGAPIVLEVEKLKVPPLLKEVSFSLHEGEILGLAGLVGSGRTELLKALYGAAPRSGGQIRLRGEPVDFAHPEDAVRAGIGMVPEDRKDEGLLLHQSVRENASLASLSHYARLGWINREKENAIVASGCAQSAVKFDTLEQAISKLSGGNQQKVVLLRWLLRDCSILLLDEPTRGIDISGKENLYALLRGLADKGKSLLVVSSEMEELMLLCDRIAVLSGGRISAEFTPDTWSRETLTEAAFQAHLAST